MTLAELVFEDLASRIESHEAAPCKLTFSALAKHYKVSLTPVRTAVTRLVTEGYLRTLDNGRLQVSDNPPPARRRSASSLPLELPKDHEATIRADLIRRSLMGDTRYIREAAAAARYGIGRTVLRPILSRLAGQGLLEHVPRCGWRVRKFDKKDLSDFVEVREALELKALEEARTKLQKEALEQFLEGNRSRGGMQIGALNNNLHSYWIKLSGNRYIIDFFERQALYYTTLFDYAAPEAHVVEEMAAQHREILEALIDERWGDAKKALVRHIRDQQPIVEQLMEQIQSGAGEVKPDQVSA
jgi:DNA-binding GntR family transcriptional regulator